MRGLSIVMPYYRNPGMLARQYETWSKEWGAGLRALIEVVIVDDGSPVGEDAMSVDMPADLPAISIYRVLEDRPWHQHGARNLGAAKATGRWLLMTDMDHVIPAPTIVSIWNDPPGLREVITFGRVDAPAGAWHSADALKFKRTVRESDGTIKPHVNSFCIRDALWQRVGGYDEDYCGVYGTDKLFRRRLYEAATERHMPDAPLIRVDRAVIADASTVGLPRKEGRDPGSKKAIAAAKASRGDAHRIVTLNFPWERVL